MQQHFIPAIVIMIALLGACQTTPDTAVVAAPDDLVEDSAIDWINGTWALDIEDMERIAPEGVEAAKEEQCDKNPEIATVSTDQKSIGFLPKFPEPEDFRPNDFIVESEPTYLKLQCNRAAENADCNEWDWYIFFDNPDRYVWVRDDWFDEEGYPLGSTAARNRCKVPVT